MGAAPKHVAADASATESSCVHAHIQSSAKCSIDGREAASGTAPIFNVIAHGLLMQYAFVFHQLQLSSFAFATIAQLLVLAARTLGSELQPLQVACSHMQDDLLECLSQSQADELDLWHDRHLLRQRLRQLEAKAVLRQETSDQLDSTLQQLLTGLQAARAAKVRPLLPVTCTFSHEVEMSRSLQHCQLFSCSAAVFITV